MLICFIEISLILELIQLGNSTFGGDGPRQVMVWSSGKACLHLRGARAFKQWVELEPHNLTAAQKPITAHTHLHLITCLPDLESNLIIPLPTWQCPSSQGDSPSLPCLPPVSWPETSLPFTHLAAKLHGSSSNTHAPLQLIIQGLDKSNDNSSIFLTWLYSQVYNIYVPSI